jgi:hypothetical protein
MLLKANKKKNQGHSHHRVPYKDKKIYTFLVKKISPQDVFITSIFLLPEI